MRHAQIMQLMMAKRCLRRCLVKMTQAFAMGMVTKGQNYCERFHLPDLAGYKGGALGKFFTGRGIAWRCTGNAICNGNIRRANSCRGVRIVVTAGKACAQEGFKQKLAARIAHKHTARAVCPL